ncbi:hypothetical protein [Pandoraea soli]
MKKLRSILGWTALLIGLAVVGTIGKQIGKEMFSASKSAVDGVERQLSSAVEQINQKGPSMLDQETRIDGATAGPGRRLTYLYTLVNHSSKDQEAIAVIQTHVKPEVAKNSCNKMKAILKAGVTVVFDYRGSDGHEMGTFDVNQSTCESLGLSS